MFLDGISEDKIAYVAQACNEVTFSTRSFGVVSGVISSKNFKHTEKRLYIETSHTHFGNGVYEEDVMVNFVLKKYYFEGLQKFVASLSNVTISRLLPTNVSVFKEKSLDDCYERLNLQKCSEDQRNALVKIVSCPNGSHPPIVTGPFGTGKTYVLALAAHYFLQNKSTTTILVCTQQHTSADAFLHCFNGLLISTPKDAVIARVKKDHSSSESKDESRSVLSYNEFGRCFLDYPPTTKRPYVIVTTCQGAYQLKKNVLKQFSFTHILIDEVGHMRESEAIAPLSLANNSTQIVLAGDKYQVSCMHNYNELGVNITLSSKRVMI